MEGNSEKSKTRLLLWIVGIFLVPVIGFILYIWLALTWSFSQGERVGYIQKLSKSGWVCKTWEGEMAMVNFCSLSGTRVWPSASTNLPVNALP
jgi:hypothetical protein